MAQGRRGQCGSSVLEVLHRIIRVIRFLILLALTVSIGFIGAILRALASLARSEMVFEQPSTPPPQLSAAVKPKVSICSFNTILFPEFLGCFTGMRPVMDRGVCENR